MANAFTITISAVDKATATVRKVNDAVSRLTRPFGEANKSFKGLGRELGFDRIGKDLGKIGREARSAAEGITSIVAPMAAITGIGSVAGIAALASNWAKLGRTIDNGARSIGVSSTQLQSFQGAAKLVGIDAETTTGSLDSLAKTMQDAQWGRDQGALVMFNKLSGGLKKTKDGANDVIGEFGAVADAIAKETNPQVQKLIANSVGLGAMLPFLRQGSAGINQYRDSVQRLGYVMSEDAVKRAKEFSVSMAGLEIAVDGTKNSIGDQLIPVMKPLVDQFANWLAANRELIATDIGNWARGFATWINGVDWKAVGTGITDFAQGVGKIVDRLGGWENAALVVVGVMNAGLIGSVVGLGVTLLAGGARIVAFIALMAKWATTARAAAAATELANGAAAAGAGRGGALLAGAGAATVVGSSLLLSGDQSDDSRDASALQNAAIEGDRGAALKLARQQLDHWYMPAVTPDSLNQRADEISSGKQAGMSPEQVQAARAKAQARRGNADSTTGFFMAQGWTREQAAGITASLGTESQYDPAAVGDSGAAYGLAQWHEDRQRDFEKWAGKSIKGSSKDEQMRFVQYELTQGSRKAAGDALRATTTATDAGGVVSRLYEAPKDRDGEAARRGQLAESLAQPAPQGPFAQGGAAGAANGTVKVEIEHKNAPEGTKVNVKTDGNVQASSRIAYSGVGAIA